MFCASRNADESPMDSNTREYELQTWALWDRRLSLHTHTNSANIHLLASELQGIHSKDSDVPFIQQQPRERQVFASAGTV